MKRRVLFVCTANSARSLMAEVLLRDMASDQFEVASAGTDPGQPHPLALAALHKAGLPTDGLYSKPLGEVQDQHWDYVITLCEKAARECGDVCQPAQQIAWDFPDPAESDRLVAFSRILKELKERIGLFTLVHQKETGVKPMSPDPVTVFKALGDEFRLAALLLIRREQQLCVCELTEAFDVPQPRVSRHLATLREAGLLDTERRGQWIYYSLNRGLPPWLAEVIARTAEHNESLVGQPLARLQAMPGRPLSHCP